jgi:hypothetical protein
MPKATDESPAHRDVVGLRRELTNVTTDRSTASTRSLAQDHAQNHAQNHATRRANNLNQSRAAPHAETGHRIRDCVEAFNLKHTSLAFKIRKT